MSCPELVLGGSKGEKDTTSELKELKREADTKTGNDNAVCEVLG